MIEVFVSVVIEIATQVKEGLREKLPIAQQQRQEQAADPAIAIAKRMDRFELVVNERQTDKRWNSRFLVQKFLEAFQSIVHLHHRRRNVARVSESSLLAHIVLHVAEVSRALILSSYASHQLSMSVPDQAEAHRQSLELIQAEVQRVNVIAYLLYVFCGRLGLVHFGKKQLLRVSYRALNSARKKSLTLLERSDEHVRIGKRAADAIQLAQGPRCFFEGANNPSFIFERRR
ncbi:MAG: hypothetical protein WAJ86_13965 [Candidatus Acidiferrales bacterium]